MAEKSGRTVFIGNIPYGLSDEQIVQICSTVGQVLSFRLIYDQETGRPKGYGFAEFADADAAASAVRNLDKYSISGRELRVDFSHVEAKDNAGGNPSDAGMPPNYQPSGPPGPPPPGSGSGAGPPAAGGGSAGGTNPGFGPFPPGAEVPPGLTAPDAISQTLATLPPPQLLDIVSQMKTLVMTDPGRATELLRQAPQLAYAIFQALLLLGLVDSSLIASVVEQAAPGPGQGQAGPPGQGQAIPSRPYPQPVPVPPPQQQAGVPSYAGYAPTPPNQPGYGPPGRPGPPPVSTPQQAPQLPPGQEELIKQILQLSPADLDKLPPAEKAQVMALRQQYGGMAY